MTLCWQEIGLSETCSDADSLTDSIHRGLSNISLICCCPSSSPTALTHLHPLLLSQLPISVLYTFSFPSVFASLWFSPSLVNGHQIPQLSVGVIHYVVSGHMFERCVKESTLLGGDEIKLNNRSLVIWLNKPGHDQQISVSSATE